MGIKLTIRYSVVLLILFTILSALILRSVFKTVLAGIILSYIFYPVYGAVYSRLRMKTVSALLITVLVLLLLTVPSYFVAKRLLTEVPTAFVITKQYLGGGKAGECKSGDLCQLIPESIKNADPNTKAVLTSMLGQGTAYITRSISELLRSLPAIVLNLFIVFFIMYYMFKDGVKLVETVKNILPLRKQRQDALIEQFSQVASAVIYGTVIVAVLQGVLAGIGFFLFGVPSPIIWGIITAVVSLIPFLGPYVVWFPVSLVLMASGYYSGEGLILLRGLGLFFYGLLLVSGIDNVLKPRIIGRKAKIHPALVFLGIIGGVNFFGLVGFVIGPVIIAMLKTAFEAYIKERAQPAAPEE